MALETGDRVPDEMTVLDRDGNPFPLRRLRGEAALLIFLRHLGWLPCQEHLVEVAERLEDIDGHVACITFAEPGMLGGFERKMKLPYPVHADPERKTYGLFGFPRASSRRVWLDPRVWWRYATLLSRGRRPGTGPDQDERQLGGDVVLDASGRLAWLYRSRGPEDRPPVDELVEAVNEARGSSDQSADTTAS